MNGNVTIPAEMLAQIIDGQQEMQRKFRKLAKENRKLRRQQRQYGDPGSWGGGFDMAPAVTTRQFAAPAGIVDTVRDCSGTYVPAAYDAPDASPSLFGNRKINAKTAIGAGLVGGIVGALAVGFIMSINRK